MVEPIDAFYRDLGARLRRHRAARRWSQAKLGESLRSPLTRASIANVEAGAQRVYAHTLADLADALGVGVAEIIPTGGRVAAGEDRPHDLARELATKLGKPQEQVAALASSILKSRGHSK